MRFIGHAIGFLGGDIWRIRIRDLPPGKSLLLRIVRIAVLSLREFDKDKCALRASALTYYTLLSIVPMLAMAFGIAKGFGMEEKLESSIREKLQWESGMQVQEEMRAMLGGDAVEGFTSSAGLTQVADYAISFANNMLENVKGGWVAGIGVLLLFWVIVKTLGNIERSFNDIWGIRKSRAWPRKFSDYLAFMVVGPVVFVMAGSATGLVVARGEELVRQLGVWGWVGDAAFTCLRILPLSLVWLLFAFTYLFMPNRKVRWSSGIVAGIVAGTLYQIVQVVYLHFQIGVTRYNAVYGSFAALPVFLVWLQTSWLIVLYGAELSFAHSHVDTYEYEPDCQRARRSLKNRLALTILRMVQRGFERGDAPLMGDALTDRLGAPVRLVEAVLYELSEAGLLRETSDMDRPARAYLPGRDLSGMTIADVLEGMEDQGVAEVPVAALEEFRRVDEALTALRAARRATDANVPVRNL